MKQKRRTQHNLIRLALLAGVVFAVGCGGGGESRSASPASGSSAIPTPSPSPTPTPTLSPSPSPSPTPVPTPSPSPSPSPTPVADERITSLSENPSDTPVDMSVYQTQDVTISLSDLNMQGEKYFAKITTMQNDVVFLGQIPTSGEFRVPVHVELIAYPLAVEVFTNSQFDQPYIMEVYSNAP